MQIDAKCVKRRRWIMIRGALDAGFALGFAAALALSSLLLAATTAIAEQRGEEIASPRSGNSPSNRHPVSFNPEYEPGQIIVSFADRRLYHVTATGRAVSYPIAVPRSQSRWQGTTNISLKRENPSWTPTADMRRENPRLPTWVPGGHPMNPMGVRALYLGDTAYRIHGTDAPWTIGTAASKGCIRMFNEDVLHLYPLIPVGTKVTVTWQRFKSGVPVADGRSDSEGEIQSR